MSELMRWADGQNAEPLQSTRLTRWEEKKNSRALTRLDHRADLQSRAVEHEAEMGVLKAQAVSHVGSAALTAQAMLAARERMLVETEPGAIHGVAFISQKLTLALGQVIDDTVREINR